MGQSPMPHYYYNGVVREECSCGTHNLCEHLLSGKMVVGVASGNGKLYRSIIRVLPSAGGGCRKMKKILMGMIRFYRRQISPFLGSHCRFSPTCSQYGLQAIEKYGALKGSWLTLKRLIRCNPFCKGGYDPVP